MGGRLAVFSCYVASCLFVSTLYGVLTANNWPVHKIAPSIVRIDVQGLDGKKGNCTAFSISEQGRFVTASHCAVGAVWIGYVPMSVVARDEASDLAVLETPHGARPPLVLGREPRPGDAVLSVGVPLSSPEPLYIPGTYQGVFDAWRDGQAFGVLFGNAMPGMSGGPVVDIRGEVVGVVLGGGNPSTVWQNVGSAARYADLRKVMLMWRSRGE